MELEQLAPWVYLAALTITGVIGFVGKNKFVTLVKLWIAYRERKRDYWTKRYQSEISRIDDRVNELQDEVQRLRNEIEASHRESTDLGAKLRLAIDYIVEVSVQWAQRLPGIAPPEPPAKLRRLLGGD